MKKIFVYIIPLFISVSCFNDQIPGGQSSYSYAMSYDRTLSFGDNGADMATAIAVDHQNAVVASGYFGSVTDFDPSDGTNIYTAFDVADAFVVKFSANGGFQWARQIGGTNIDRSYGVGCDENGNVYVSGYFNGACQFDSEDQSEEIVSVGATDGFVTKFSADGNYIWTKTFGSVSADGSMSIAVQSDGAFAVAGYCNGVVDFDPGAPVYEEGESGRSSFFVSYFDANGDFQWAHAYGNQYQTIGRDVVIDPDGNVIVTGYITGTVEVGLFTIGESTAQHSFLVKLDENGNELWAVFFEGYLGDEGYDVDCDTQGNIYLAGEYHGTNDFDPAPNTTNALKSRGSDDLYVVSLDANGDFRWVRSAGGDMYESGQMLTVDSMGNIFVGGFSFSTNNSFDPGNGDLKSSQGDNDVFANVYNASGVFGWNTMFGGNYADWPGGMVCDSSGNLYISGCFQGTVDFDPGNGVDEHRCSGQSEAFITKYVPDK